MKEFIEEPKRTTYKALLDLAFNKIRGIEGIMIHKKG